MNKPLYKSGTIWGFGLAGLIAIAQVLGISYSETTTAKLVEILTAPFGIFRLRTSIN